MKARFKKAIERLVKRTGQSVFRYNVETLGWLKWLEAYDNRFHKSLNYIRKQIYLSETVRKRYISGYMWQKMKSGTCDEFTKMYLKDEFNINI